MESVTINRPPDLERCNRIAFSIVTYKEVFYEAPAYQSVIDTLSDYAYKEDVVIYIYDNTDIPNWKVDYSHLTNFSSIRYHFNQGNPGISVAYNHNAKRAFEAGFAWIVFLDQDTKIPVQAMYEYFTAINKRPEIGLKAPILKVNEKIFSPSKFFLNKSILVQAIRPGLKRLDRYTIINSGMLVNLNLFFKVGGYNEKLKMDFTDFQFVKKVRAVDVFFELLPFTCEHDFSDNEKDLSKAVSRYAVFLNDIRHCTKNGWKDFIGYQVVGLLHLIKLSVKYKSFKFASLYIQRIKKSK